MKTITQHDDSNLTLPGKKSASGATPAGMGIAATRRYDWAAIWAPMVRDINGTTAYRLVADLLDQTGKIVAYRIADRWGTEAVIGRDHIHPHGSYLGLVAYWAPAWGAAKAQAEHGIPIWDGEWTAIPQGHVM